MKIDIHSHCIPETFIQKIRDNEIEDHVRIIISEDGKEALLLNGRKGPPLTEDFLNPEKKIKGMDKRGIDVHALSISPPLYLYGLPDKVGTAIARTINDDIMGIVNKYPGRFIGLATLPMQNLELALKEMERSLSMGMKGLSIGTSLNEEVYFDHPKFIPFFASVQKAGCPVVLHPPHVPLNPRLDSYHLVNLIGNPLDTTIGMARIVFGGILEKFPELKLCFVHAGGQVPYLMGRFDHGFRVRKECKKNIFKPPSEYIKMLYYDTITHHPLALKYLIEQMGSDHIVIGSDDPADMADYNSYNILETMDISENEKEMIYGKNAQLLFNL